MHTRCRSSRLKSGGVNDIADSAQGADAPRVKGRSSPTLHLFDTRRTVGREQVPLSVYPLPVKEAEAGGPPAFPITNDWRSA